LHTDLNFFSILDLKLFLGGRRGGGGGGIWDVGKKEDLFLFFIGMGGRGMDVGGK